MEFKEIDQLINKYFEGETSLEEEAKLKAFFRSRDLLPEKYQRIKAMFSLYETGRTGTSKLKIENIIPFQKKKSNSFRIFYYAAAACITILFGIWFMQESATKKPVYAYINGKPVENHEQAYKEAQKALMMVSKNLNNGAKNVSQLSELDKALSSVSGK